MPRRPSHVPAYRLHKPSGQARVIIDGQHIYLGRYGSPESREKYARILAESATRQPTAMEPPSSGSLFPCLSVSELILAYWRFAETYYCKEGKPTKELACMKEALHPLRHLYGATSARDFGPRSLKAVRHHMVSQGLSRGVVNHRVGRIKRVFKWAVAEELIPPSVYSALQAVTGLRYGRTQARETEPVRPVPDNSVEALRPYVAPQVAAMIQLQRLTGMRSCEVVIMRPCDIHRDGDVWNYEPYDHKNRWRGHRNLVPLGPKAQEILKSFLEREPTSYLFSPREADAWHRKHRPVHCKESRKTPIYPSELRARQKAKLARRNRKPKKEKRDHYDTDSYRRAVNYGIKRARKAGVEIPRWHPHQLRHSRGTEIRNNYGIEAAQVALVHARADITEVYAEKNMELAIQIARETG